MPRITYVDSEGEARTVEAEVGSTVMETAIRNDIPAILASCAAPLTADRTARATYATAGVA